MRAAGPVMTALVADIPGILARLAGGESPYILDTARKGEEGGNAE
jgi:hypothetical protein